jgi:ABC-type uncharacterized transport system substrate-binding protein
LPRCRKRGLRTKGYRLGFLLQSPRTADNWAAFFAELAKRGFDGRNLAIINGFNTSPELAEAKAQEIAETKPDAILTAGVFTGVVQEVTKTIPILTVSDDLLAEHAVQSLANPGGKTTGISILATELDGKRQEILLEASPQSRRLALLADLEVTRPAQLKMLENAAKARGIVVSTHVVANANEIGPAITEAADAQAMNALP